MRIKQKSSEEMYSLIKIWEQTNNPVTHFCKERNLSVASFHYWLKKYRHKNTVSSQSGFVSLTISEKQLLHSGSCELIFPDGRKLIFYDKVEASFLLALLS